MLNVTKELQGDLLTVRLSGSIEERTALEPQIGELPGTLRVNTREVTRINSEGVKMWMIYFQKLEKMGRKVEFIECSPAIMEQANLIRNFTCGGTILSLYLPFCCESCSQCFLSLFEARILAGIKSLPTPACTKCGARAIFDDHPDEYFAFLSRQGLTTPKA